MPTASCFFGLGSVQAAVDTGTNFIAGPGSIIGTLEADLGMNPDYPRVRSGPLCFLANQVRTYPEVRLYPNGVKLPSTVGVDKFRTNLQYTKYC